MLPVLIPGKFGASAFIKMPGSPSRPPPKEERTERENYTTSSKKYRGDHLLRHVPTPPLSPYTLAVCVPTSPPPREGRGAWTGGGLPPHNAAPPPPPRPPCGFVKFCAIICAESKSNLGTSPGFLWCCSNETWIFLCNGERVQTAKREERRQGVAATSAADCPASVSRHSMAYTSAERRQPRRSSDTDDEPPEPRQGRRGAFSCV